MFSVQCAFLFWVALLGAARSSNGVQFQTEPDLFATKGRHLLTCTNPAETSFKSSIYLSTYTSTACTTTEQSDIKARINVHWSNYVAYHSTLGQVNILSKSIICRNRKLASNETLSLQIAKDERRQLPALANGFQIIIGLKNGVCAYCKPDSMDRRLEERRLTSSVPVTIHVDTDQYFREMSFKIKNRYGNVVASHSAFTMPLATKLFEFLLVQGETYTLELADSYGDGWCCQYGYGGVKVFDGRMSTGMDLIGTYSGLFGSGISYTFQVPSLGVAARSAGYANVADILFPEIESGLSNYLTYYIQQDFNYRGGHCLFNKAPFIWVDMEQTSSLLSC